MVPGHDSVYQRSTVPHKIAMGTKPRLAEIKGVVGHGQSLLLEQCFFALFIQNVIMPPPPSPVNESLECYLSYWWATAAAVGGGGERVIMKYCTNHVIAVRPIVAGEMELCCFHLLCNSLPVKGDVGRG